MHAYAIFAYCMVGTEALEWMMKLWMYVSKDSSRWTQSSDILGDLIEIHLLPKYKFRRNHFVKIDNFSF